MARPYQTQRKPASGSRRTLSERDLLRSRLSERFSIAARKLRNHDLRRLQGKLPDIARSVIRPHRAVQIGI